MNMPRITASTGVLAAIAVAVVIAIAVLDRAGTPGTQQAGAPEIQQVGEVPAIGPLPAKKAPKASMVEMGKRLFFDARISGDGAVSCAFCHDPAQGFGISTDKNGKPQRLSEAYPGTNHFRNAPTLVNTTYKEDFASVDFTGVAAGIYGAAGVGHQGSVEYLEAGTVEDNLKVSVHTRFTPEAAPKVTDIMIENTAGDQTHHARIIHLIGPRHADRRQRAQYGGGKYHPYSS